MKVYYNLTELNEEVKASIRNIGFSSDMLNDKGLGRMFSEVFKKVLRYNPKSKSWYCYNGMVWKEDLEELSAKYFAKIFSDELLAYCEELSLDAKTMAKVQGLSSMSKRNTIINDARCECPLEMDELDADINLLNCKNGTLNLKTFELQPHNADDLLSKITNVKYDPHAKCERWEQFIIEVMENDMEKAEYLQRILGNCLTADVNEEEFYILYGATARNGKSTLLETVSHLLGGTRGYSVNIATTTFSGKKERSASSPNSDLARLAGVRMAVTNELPKNMVIDTGIIKTMTGRDRITARHLYAKEFEFTPQFKLFLNTNHLPRIMDDTMFTSGRVNVIEFNRHFTKQEQDKTLKSTLRKNKNLSGILNWLISGLKKAREYGMTPPQSVIQATARFREDCDKVGCFISECLENTGKNTTLKDVYEAYQKWTAENGYGCESKTKFKSELESKNLVSKTGTVAGKTEYNVIKGYTIVSESEQKTPRFELRQQTQSVISNDPTDIF